MRKSIEQAYPENSYRLTLEITPSGPVRLSVLNLSSMVHADAVSCNTPQPGQTLETMRPRILKTNHFINNRLPNLNIAILDLTFYQGSELAQEMLSILAAQGHRPRCVLITVKTDHSKKTLPLSLAEKTIFSALLLHSREIILAGCRKVNGYPAPNFVKIMTWLSTRTPNMTLTIDRSEFWGWDETSYEIFGGMENCYAEALFAALPETTTLHIKGDLAMPSIAIHEQITLTYIASHYCGRIKTDHSDLTKLLSELQQKKLHALDLRTAILALQVRRKFGALILLAHPISGTQQVPKKLEKPAAIRVMEMLGWAEGHRPAEDSQERGSIKALPIMSLDIKDEAKQIAVRRAAAREKEREAARKGISHLISANVWIRTRQIDKQTATMLTHTLGTRCPRSIL